MVWDIRLFNYTVIGGGGVDENRKINYGKQDAANYIQADPSPLVQVQLELDIIDKLHNYRCGETKICTFYGIFFDLVRNVIIFYHLENIQHVVLTLAWWRKSCYPSFSTIIDNTKTIDYFFTCLKGGVCFPLTNRQIYISSVQQLRKLRWLFQLLEPSVSFQNFLFWP